MPPRRSTPRKGRSDASVAQSPAPEPTSTGSPASTPRRTTRTRRSATKASTTDSPAPSSPAPKSSPAKSPNKSRASKATTIAIEHAGDTIERVHELPKRTNPRLEEVKSRQVKLQVIRREDKEIIIGRIKLPTVNGAEHGFLLKRFDTNAIAGSSMFRLAFPYADAEEESAEMTYLESRFDTDAANGGFIAPPRARSRKSTAAQDSPSKKAGKLPPGSTGVRLQGVWIPCEHASSIASDYGLLELAQPLIEATAILLPNDNTPILNPDADTIASAAVAAAAAAASKAEKLEDVAVAAVKEAAAETAQDVVSSTHATEHDDATTRVRQPKRARTTAISHDSHTPTVKEEDTLTSSKRPATRRSTRAATAAAASAAVLPDPSASLTPAQIDAQIRESQKLAAKVQAEAMKQEDEVDEEAEAEAPKRAPKRRAEDDDAGEGVVVAQQQTSPSSHSQTGLLTRRHRPLRRAAGVLTAAGAMGIGAMAWYTGSINLSANVPNMLQQLQHVDYTSTLHALQQNIQNWGVSSWFG